MQWKEIEPLFEKALTKPPDQRADWLADVCNDPTMLDEVAQLLAAHERAGGILDTSPFAVAADLADQAMETPRRVGSYRLVREIGRGGMGTVYLAERDDEQFFQEVAIKILRPDLNTDDLVQRFLTERQILASLHHPNIAQLHDGGVTGDGRPYFVMEYVEGEPITTYCDEHRLSIKERLHLFTDAVQAVQYAHRNLVVHRDLKPSNILVTGDGVVKLLDFGIAKLLDPDALPHPEPITRTGLHPMTPEYASPEQMRSAAISTASDVYQLGVVLYELLTGHRPYHLAGRSASDIERVICYKIPVPPSTMVLRILDAATDPKSEAINPEQISSARRTSPVRLQKKLQGDLDTMLLMALRKEPARRYESAEQLGEDIERYLTRRPVLARSDTLGYRMGKFLGRYRWSVASVTIILLLIIAYAATVTLQARQIARERDRAQIEVVKTLHIKDFLIDLFGKIDPTASKENLTMVEDVLADGAKRVRLDLADQPEIRAEMLSALGAVYQQLGNYDAARPLLHDALAARRSRFGDTHEAVASSLQELADLEHQAEHPARAETLYRDALALQRTLHDTNPIAVAEAQNQLASLLQEIDQLQEAESLYAEALPVYRRVIGEGHGQTAMLAHRLGRLHIKQDHPEQAAPLFREALTLQQRRLPENDHRLVVLHSDLGAALTALQQYDKAEQHLLNAYAVIQNNNSFASDSLILERLVVLYEHWGKPDEATRYLSGLD